MNKAERLHHLIALYLIDHISEEEFEELSNLLRSDATVRDVFHRACRADIELAEIVATPISSINGVVVETKQKPSSAPIVAWSLLAATVAISLFALWALHRSTAHSEIIAEIVSAEDAAWESALPTEPGAKLSRGTLNLKTGVATIRFTSGAEMTMEGPSSVDLESSMKAHLKNGTAMLDVPDSAKGFIVATPDGYAIDYGTRFTVRVHSKKGISQFDLIEGEIEVHEPKSGTSINLPVKGKRARVRNQRIVVPGVEWVTTSAQSQEAPIIRVYTRKKTGSTIRDESHAHVLHKDILSVKLTKSGKWDQRSFFSFDYSAIDLENVLSVSLRLNLVSSTKGFATRLPKINRFAIHGLTNPAKEDWTHASSWADSPGPEDGILLGTFETRRSQQQGTFIMDDSRLLDFLKASKASGTVSLILTRTTSEIADNGPAFAHHFASASHPEAVGPMLEFEMRD